MNMKNLAIAALVGGIVSTILSNVPILNFVNCLLCAGFWAGALLAVWLYKRLSGAVTLQQGVIIGAAAGLVAGVIGFALSFVNVAGAAALIETYSRFMPEDADIDVAALASGPVKIVMNLLGIGVNIIFGAVGGLIGGAIFKPRAQTTPSV
jgi:hypothetical protein